MSFEFNPTQIRQKKEVLLNRLRRILPVADFVLLRNTLDKVTEEAIAENARFEEALLNGQDEFANDVIDTDPLAFIIRGTLHIEGQLDSLLQELGIPFKKKDKLEVKINRLRDSGSYSKDRIAVLHVIRWLRNRPAHDLEAGRSVPESVKQKFLGALTPTLKREMEYVCGEKIASLSPEMVVKMVMNNAFVDLESTARHQKWVKAMQRVLPLR